MVLRVGFLCYTDEVPSFDQALVARLKSNKDVELVRIDVRSESLNPSEPPNFSVVVNRVSDSVEPKLAKVVGVFLRHFELFEIPVFNGWTAFNTASSKISQHSVLTALKLRSPQSVVVRSPLELPAAAERLGFPVLLKPNIGGYGRGIVKLGTKEEMAMLLEDDRRGELLGRDGVALLQRFHLSAGGVTQRVFFLDGQVLCAVRVIPNEKKKRGRKGGFNTCVCSVGSRGDRMVAFKPASEVTTAVQSVARKFKASFGSVEYLEDQGTGTKVFYDINMLTTLPAPKLAEQSGKIWGEGFDPHSALSDFILGMAKGREVPGDSKTGMQAKLALVTASQDAKESAEKSGALAKDLSEAGEKQSRVVNMDEIQEFKTLVKKGGPVVVKFGAKWCGPCQRIKPFFEALSNLGQFNTISFVSVDTDRGKPIARLCGVKNLPTFLVYVGGFRKGKLEGADTEKLQALCEAHALWQPAGAAEVFVHVDQDGEPAANRPTFLRPNTSELV